MASSEEGLIMLSQGKDNKGHKKTTTRAPKAPKSDRLQPGPDARCPKPLNPPEGPDKKQALKSVWRRVGGFVWRRVQDLVTVEGRDSCRGDDKSIDLDV